MRNVFAATLTVLLLACSDSWAQVADEPKRQLPHQEECTVPLPADFWDGSVAEPIRSAEAWAWNERICLGHWADMRNAPGGGGDGEACEPAEIEAMGETVPASRELRPEFLELILSHEPWASAQRHPEVGIKCALVRGDVYLDDHEIAPSVWFHWGKVNGKVDLVGTKFKGTLSLRGSTVTGKLNADGLEVGGSLFLRGGGTFADVVLLGAKVARNAEFDGSTVTGKLDADRLEVGGSLFLRGGGTFADVDLLGAKVASNAEFDGSTVTGKLNADRLEVGGSLFLRGGGTFADVVLLGAKVARNAEFDGSTVTGKLDADRLEVGGSLFLRGGGTFADVDLLGAKVASNAEFDGSTVTGKLNADGLEVGGSLFLRGGGTFADVDLLGAKVARSVSFNGSTVTGKLNADRLEVGGSLFLRGGGTFADVDLLVARIGGNVQLAGSTFRGEFNLTGAAIDGELHLSSERGKRAPTWQGGASLILRNAKAYVLQAQRDSWNILRPDPPSEKNNLLPTDLTGFAFNQLGGLGASGGTNMGDEPADWLIKWIEAQRDHGQHYDPQPYTQLAKVLDAAGATEKAKSIRYAKFEHKLDHDESMGMFRRVLLTLERYFVGYGVYPFRALYWFFGLVLVGGLLAQCSKDASVRRWMGPWYSLENALPLIETNERFRNVVHGHPVLVHFFHFQKAFGFVLATVLVGALTLLGG